MKKIDRRIIKTKTSIRNAFYELITQKDLSSITITEIALKANIDRKTFYLHYDSVNAILDEFEDELADKVQELLNTNETLDLSTLFYGLNEIMLEHIDLYRHISKAASYSSFLFRYKNILKHSLTESFAAKSNMSPEAFSVYAEYISSGILSIYIDWLTSDSSLTLEELTTLAQDAVRTNWTKVFS